MESTTFLNVTSCTLAEVYQATRCHIPENNTLQVRKCMHSVTILACSLSGINVCLISLLRLFKTLYSAINM
jgi:hypothetical protein